MQPFGIAGGEGEGIEIDLEAALDAGPQHLHRHRLRPGRRSRPRRGAPVRSRRRRPAGRTPRTACSSGLPSPASTAARPRLRKRRHLVLQAFEVARQRDADHVRPRRQELAELHIAGPSRSARRRAGWRHRARRGRSISRATLIALRAGSGSRAVSISANTPSRANTKPAWPDGRDGRCAAGPRHGRSAAVSQSRQPECSCDDAAGHAAVNETRRKPAPSASSSANTVGPRKAANRFHQIAIGLGVAGDRAPERRDHVERVEIVEPVEPGHIDRRKTPGREIVRRPCSTRCASASAASMRGTLRMPNAMVTASKLRSGNGSASALPSTKVIVVPGALGARSRPTASISALMSVTVTRVPRPPACGHAERDVAGAAGQIEQRERPFAFAAD